MKIYTKTGDQGETSLIGGTRVPKDHPRIEAYGDMDELKSWIGLIRDQEEDIRIKKVLLEIQDRLFSIESHLAAEKPSEIPRIPPVTLEDTRLLEREIDLMNETLAPLTSFILPGGHSTASLCHIARTICRRVERRIISLHHVEMVSSVILEYVNRLSDYLFVLARFITSNYGGTETPWYPKR
jgi:cob(I)alamin adenosyltransferase